MTEQVAELAKRFPSALVKQVQTGGGGRADYVSHSTINERALSIVGPFSFEVVEVVRGFAPEKKSRDGKRTWPARENAVLGCIARLTVNIDGREVVIGEIGSEDEPAMNSDSENLKNAASDAFKRCWMRTGLGLHLWSQSDYWLDKFYAKDPDWDASWKPHE